MADSDLEDVLLIQKLQLQALLLQENSHKTRIYQRTIFSNRRKFSEFYHLYQELKLVDHEYFVKYLRLTPGQVEDLLIKVAPKIQHRRHHRVPITPGERLILTLR